MKKVQRVKCAVCGEYIYDYWVWQPFGPSEDPRDTFTTPGSHYRGFPSVKVCWDCKVTIQVAFDIWFTYKKQTFVIREERDEYNSEWLGSAS